jgi:hypothetical protein
MIILQVDFAPPIGYVDPSRPEQSDEESPEVVESVGFIPFLGSGNRYEFQYLNKN